MSNTFATTALSAHWRGISRDCSDEPPHVAETIEMFGNLRQPLLRYLLTFGMRACDVEEIVQEAFLALFKHLEAGRPKQNLQGWLFRVCHNLSLKHLNATRSAREVISTQVDWLNFHADVAPNPEETLLQAQRHAKLQSILRALSEQDRCCICLRAEGLRYREIAAVLGISLGAVSNSLTRSLKRFERADQE